MDVVKKSLGEQIYALLKSEIISGVIGFGEKLVNRDLQTRFGVSSSPVRDAINLLYQAGLVEEISKVGARVINFDEDFAVDINEMISILSVAAIRLSAKCGHTQAVAATLEESLFGQVNSCTDADYQQYDQLFHQAFFDYCDNESCKKVYSQYDVLYSILIKRYYGVNTDHGIALRQHRAILEAYRTGDIPKAQAAMQEHYELAADLLRGKYRPETV